MDLRLDETKNGIRERVGSIVGSQEPVPLALWTPEGATPARLVMVGHGASGNKQEEYVVALARALVRHHGFAVCAIDGPVHGDRRDPTSQPFVDFAQRWSADDHLTDHMVTDWRDTIDALFFEGVVTPDAQVGYWGLSMGTILGLPLVAAEPRIAAAVLGLMGATGPTKERIVADAQRITVPTMFLLQWDDELFSRDKGFALFTEIAATDKTLIATPGAHAEVTAETFRRTTEFLADRLEKAEQAAK